MASPPQIKISTSAASSLSLKNIYVTNKLYNLKQVGLNPATLPQSDGLNVMVFFLFTSLQAEIIDTKSG